jgi:predicted nucleotidyltransferase
MQPISLRFRYIYGMKPETALEDLIRVNDFAWSLYNSNPENEKKRKVNTQDIKLVIANFDLHKVEYILIGGFAMAFHGHVRATNDVDLWIKNTPANMRRLREALIACGIPEARGLRDTSQLGGGFTVFNMMESDFQIDLFHNLKSFKEVDFDECYARAKTSDYNGVQIRVLGAEDLLTEKKSTGREKDLGDVSFLQKLVSKIGIRRDDKGMSM